MNKGVTMKNQAQNESLTNMDRRDFLKTAGIGAAAAGTTIVAGCRKPTQYILPYGKRPEDVIPGKPTYYATGMNIGATVEPLLVESHDGRPTKIEGNPGHPLSNGATSGWGQSSILDLYDPDRSRQANHGADTKTPEEVDAALGALAKSFAANGGKGLALLTQWVPSPSYSRALRDLKKALPNAKMFMHDPMWSSSAHAGAQMVNLNGVSTTLELDNAKVIVSLDSDFLGSEGDTVRNTRGFSAGRQVDEEPEKLNRLYTVEPRYTLTGTSADHRLQIRGSQVGEFLAELARTLKSKGLAVPAGAILPVPKLDAGVNAELAKKWLTVLADDLVANKGKSLVVVGDHQPSHVHALGHLVNSMLGAFGTTISMSKGLDLPVQGGVSELAALLDSGEAETVVILGSNPVYTTSGDLDFSAKLAKAKTTLHLGQRKDETGKDCTWHIPMSHFLEAWGDLQGSDGSALIQQPLIAPLFEARSALEIVLALQGYEGNAHDYVKATWMSATQQEAPFLAEKKKALENAQEALKGAEAEKALLGNAAPADAEGAADTAATSMAAAAEKVERAKTAVDTAQKDLTSAEVAAKAAADKAAAERTAAWGTWIQKGIINNGSTDTNAAFSWDKIAGAWASRNTPADSGFELNFISDYSVGDGRFANNSWLQEMPEPITKITWDNAASISKGTARELNINTGDMVKITSNGATLEIAACVTHGVAEGSIILPLGYGRTHGGKFATGAGFNAYSLMNGSDWIQSGATLAKSMGSYQLAITQMEKGDFSGEIQTRIDGLVRENTVDGYKKEKDFVKKYEVMPKDKLKSLFNVPDNSEGEQWNSVGQQWGMTVDLSSCNGCNACAIACQAENNVAVVGKKEVANGREMHWLRMDRYFDGTDENPDSAIQPMSCSHCENAPCETVCPVAATAHGPEGTNDIAYNRCIGTRYCANNCPYKVRRFNYYNFSKRMDEDYGPLIAMQRNPDVTVRFRGVIEKCSYCVQRITEAHIEAKTTGDRTGIVPDGGIQAACSQACAAGAITFGDVNDPTTAVSKKKASPRNYAMLAELNIHPRTTYLARIRNPNPALVEG